MVLDDKRREALAQLLADDVPFRQASRAAGYVHCWKARALARTKRVDVVARVAEIRRARALEAADLTPMIDALMAAAKNAQDLEKTAAGLTAIRGLLVEAARLKGLAPPPPPLEPTQPRRRMSDEEWMETFAPKPVVAR